MILINILETDNFLIMNSFNYCNLFQKDNLIVIWKDISHKSRKRCYNYSNWN